MLVFSLVVALTVVSYVTGSSLFFQESFDGEDPFSSGKWVKSKDEKYNNQPVMVKSSSKAAPGVHAKDKGLSLTQEMKFYGVSTEFPTPLDVKDKDLAIQYELKLEEGLNCGGAYIKLPRYGESVDFNLLNNETPYTIMFGPDRCGANNDRVHFIMQHKSPVTSEWEEKHFNDPTTVYADSSTHLYTLLVRSDNSFEIYVDKEVVKSGNLLTDMTPPVNPPSEIDDPTDEKPADWVDDIKIPDPTASKPDDWDESQPATIEDPTSTKPDGWLDNAPEQIPDPEVQKPEDWDDEEDGEFEAPLIDNPACEEAGCGEWKPRRMPNPDYKGIWKAPMIDNPEYKGAWKPAQIPNPGYFEDPNPAGSMAPMAGLAVEVWTTNAGIHFDNFVIAHSLEDVFEYADNTFVPKRAAEDEQREAEEKLERDLRIEEMKSNGDISQKVMAFLAQAYNFSIDNSLAVLGTLGAVLVSIATYILTASGSEDTGSSKNEVKEKKEETKNDEGEENNDKEETEEIDDGGEAESDEDTEEEEKKAPPRRRSSRRRG